MALVGRAQYGRIALAMLAKARKALLADPQNLLVAWEAQETAAREIRQMGAMLDRCRDLFSGTDHWKRDVLPVARAKRRRSTAPSKKHRSGR